MKLLKLISTVVFMMASAFVLSACTIKPLPPTGPGSLTTNIQQASEVQIVQTSARQDGENVVVYGRVKRKITGGRGVVKGHIDIKIIDAEGKVIDRVVTSVSPKIVPKSGGMTSSFTARIPVIAPQGSVISVRFHNGPHESQEAS